MADDLPEGAHEHDVIVIGAGPAGEVMAGRLAREGLEVAIVERELVGGECAYWACMPSKALLRPAELLDEVERVPGAREAATAPLDPAVVLRRRDEVIHELSDAGQLPWLEDKGIALYRGSARLDGRLRVRVADRVLHARRAVVVAVGSGATIPSIPGLDDVEPWTNRIGTTAREVPGRLIVLGGGAVGCELAQAWCRLGAEVALVERLAALLPGEEPFAGEQLAASLRDQGVRVRTGRQAVRVHHAPGDERGRIVLELDDGEGLRGDELLVAVGRTPHTADLGLETVDLEPGTTIPVDDSMRVASPAHRDWLYAIGDVNGRALLTHSGKYQAVVAAATIMNRDARATWDGELSPRVVFTEPQVAAVGRTLQEALDAGISARAVDAAPGATAGASFTGRNARSGGRIVVDQAREVIIGATFTGPEIAESLHAATVAIVGEVPVHRLIHAIPAFPTRSEVWLRLLDPWMP
jgi:pyruvate/2-oxoglutarate dehydrogenase complex dihydrolipoamide dehydrogenase (E3) component